MEIDEAKELIIKNINKNFNIKVLIKIQELHYFLLDIKNKHNLINLSEAAYLIVNGIHYKCPACCKHKKFRGFAEGYGKFCSIKCAANFNKNNIEIRKKISETLKHTHASQPEEYWKSRTIKHKETVKSRTPERQAEIDKNIHEAKLKVHKNRTPEQKQEINNKISKTVKNSLKAKKQRIERSRKGGLKMKEIRDSMLQEEKDEYCKRYGSPSIPEEQKEQYIKYHRLVMKYTRRNSKFVENIELRGKEYHLDHKFSICEGFKQNVSPEIIGSKYNLEIIPHRENCFKQGKCSIELEELLKLFYNN